MNSFIRIYNSSRAWLNARCQPVFSLAIHILLIVSMIPGCARVEEYTAGVPNRAVQYNLDAEQVQDQELLLNIVRAAKRRPLEFTGLQSVTGSATVSGQISAAIPLSKGIEGSPMAGLISVPTLLAPSGSIALSPTATIPVLDTQEFFQGILKYIPLSTLDLYYQSRYPQILLFNLFISRIVLRQEPPESSDSQASMNIKRVLEIANDPSRDSEIDAFELIIEHLLDLGLTTEPNTEHNVVAILTPSEMAALGAISRASAANLDIQEASWCDLDEEERDALVTRLKMFDDQGSVREGNNKRTRALCTIEWICRESFNDTCKEEPREAITLNRERPDSETEQYERIREVLPNLPPLLYSIEKSSGDFKFCFRPRPWSYFNSTNLITARGDETTIRDEFNKKFAPTEIICTDDKSEAPNSNTESAGASSATRPSTNSGRGLAKSETLSNHGEQPLKSAMLAKTDKPLGFKEIYLGDLGERLNDLQCRQLGIDPTQPRCKSTTYGPINFANPVSISLIGRSTENVLYYLGELVRRELHPDHLPNTTARRRIQIPFGPSDEAIPEAMCLFTTDNGQACSSDYCCEPIIVVNEGTSVRSINPFLTISYDGHTYSIPPDDKAGHTYQVLDIVSQLLALNKSAKSLPTTSVFTLIGP